MQGDATPVVVDASAVAAVLFDEPRAAEIVALLDSHRLVAPHLILYEVLNVARKKVHGDPARRKDFLTSAGRFPDLGIEPMTPDPGQILTAALDRGLTSYDAAYLALAEQLDIPLCTLEARLRAAAGTRLLA